MKTHTILGKSIWTLGYVYKDPGHHRPCPTGTWKVLTLDELNLCDDRTQVNSISAEGGLLYFVEKHGLWTLGLLARGCDQTDVFSGLWEYAGKQVIQALGDSRDSLSPALAPPRTSCVF